MLVRKRGELLPTLKPIDAIERLFALYEQQMYRIAFAVLKDEGQAEDAVMSAFERVVRHQGVPCDPDSSHAQHLMASMARQCAIDIYRKNSRERQRFVTTLAEGAEVSAAMAQSAPGPDAADAAGAAGAADEMIAHLPKQYRDVLHDRFVEERSTRETAEHLGISEANVRKRQQRALDLLRRNMNGGETYEPLYCQQ